MAPDKVLRFVFFGLMGAIVASLFFRIFFVIDIDGHDGGVLVYLARQVEIPISQYYYTYSYVPNTLSTQGKDESFGFTTKVDGAGFTNSSNIDLSAQVTNYSGEDDVLVNAPASSSDIYTTGWSGTD